MSDIDQQFVEYVVKSLVGNPDAVHIDRRVDEKGVLLELTVDPEDLGRVIGKRGATAQSLRTLLRALGTKNDARYNLKIIDNGDGGHSDGSPDSSGQTARDSSAVSDNTAVSASPQDDSTDDQPADNIADEVSELAEPEIEAEPETDQTSDRVRQARAELADLDDLDV